MPRTRSLAWSELKIGVLMIAAIVIAAVAIFALTGGKGFFWQRYNLKTRFSNVAGLKAGSPVRLAGVEVGEVRDVQLAGNDVDVSFQVNDRYRPQITTASIAKLGSVSLLGESAVDISPSSSGTPIQEWGYVPNGPPVASMADLTDQAGRGITELSDLIHDIRAGKGTVGKFMTDEAVYNELNRFIASANDLTTTIKSGKGSVGRLLNDPTAARALEASLNNLTQLTDQLNKGQGSLGKLLHDDAFANSLSSATNNLDTLVGKINSGQGTAGKLVTDPALFNQLTAVTQKLDQVMTSLNAGDGTMGRLLKDQQLYENINAAVTDVRTLVANINKDPRKYLNIRVSVF